MILTGRDLSDKHNAHDCAEEFRRARDFGGPTELLIWAQNWSGALVDNLQNPEVSADDVDRALNEATEFEERAEHLETTISEAIEQMDTASELSTGAARAARYLEISIDLEKALIK